MIKGEKLPHFEEELRLRVMLSFYKEHFYFSKYDSEIVCRQAEKKLKKSKIR
jgi:hypothetical protein